MEWDVETRRKLAVEIRRFSLRIQEEEFFRCWPSKGNIDFSEAVENTIEKIMLKLEPLGFERANKDWKPDGELQGVSLYEDSPTHLWFETAQCRIVKIHKEHAEKLLVLGLP